MKAVVITAVLLGLAASAGWTYLKLIPESVSPVQQITVTAVSDYRIVSQKNLKAWPAGTVFDQGMIAYFYAAKPEVTVSPKVNLNGLTNGQLTGTIKSEVTIQAVNDKAEIYWSYPLQTVPEQAFTLSAGIAGTEDQFTYTAEGITLDTASAYDLVTKIGEELQFQTGVFQLVIASDIRLSGTIDGNVVSKDASIALPLTLQPSSFSAPQLTEITNEVEVTKAAEIPPLRQRIVDTAKSDPYPFLLDAALIVLLLLLVFIKGSKTKSALEHRRFKEWITEGSVDIRNKYNISIFSLEGLVDLAIDLDKRVIFDVKLNKYYVLEESMVYTYNPEHMKSILDNKQQLGKLLLERGIIRPEQLETGLYYQQKIGSKLGESLIALGFMNETTLYSTLASQLKIDYYELDAGKEISDLSWKDKLGIHMARAFQALPLGIRADGKTVVACGDISKTGIKDALKDILHTDVHIVSSKPSAIYEVLDRLEAQEKQKQSYLAAENGNRVTPYERLSEKEREQFLNAYYRGNILHNLLLKASGLVDPIVLAQVPEQDSILSWLVSRNSLGGEIVNLIKALDKVIEAMDFRIRQEKKLPEMIELLVKANYITVETTAWLKNEQPVQNTEVGRFITDNYLVSAATVENAMLLLNTLLSILHMN